MIVAAAISLLALTADVPPQPSTGPQPPALIQLAAGGGTTTMPKPSRPPVRSRRP